MPLLDIPVFAGQGVAAIDFSHTREQALHDALSHFGSLLLSACHSAFCTELSSLPTSEADAVDVSICDFDEPQDLLSLPKQEKYLSNPVISGTTLFLIQALRYLAYAKLQSHSFITSVTHSTSLARPHDLGSLGFSSGVLTACLVGASTTIFEYVSNAVEVFRLSFWIGVRAQLYRVSAVPVSGRTQSLSSTPWSLVILGMGKHEIEKAILEFQAPFALPSLYVTAVIDSRCVTISGRPDILHTFASTLSPSVCIHKTTVNTLYHSSLHANGARNDVLADASRRKIRFPTHSDLSVPVRSTYTGELLCRGHEGSLLEAVIDMVLTQPVNWDSVMLSLGQDIPQNRIIRFLNFGPGAGLVRGLESGLSSHTVSSLDLTAEATTNSCRHPSVQEPIAIVGMAVNMPGAPNVSKLWEVLQQGLNTVTEVPEHRFRVSDYHAKESRRKTSRMMKAHTGNFIDDSDAFDNQFFKISPREARNMDPQQRVLLHTAYEALENSGYVPNSTPTSNPESFGCYIGTATNDYVQNLRNDIDVYYSTGTLRAFLSGRISYAMRFSGPSIVIDTACSSSLVALQQACRALMNRDCNAALAGGVNIITSPDMFLGLDRGHFLSPTGQCMAFDASADGYSRSEGCGIFVLKRLSDAVAENDNILGVIRGIEVNQSGSADSITHPHAPTQVSLFKRVLDRSGIEANRINLIEAHGTGTQAGDPTELESIRQVFAIHRSPTNPLHVTSVKANIGHLEAASGAAGLAKLLLMLRHHVIPRQISLKHLNPKIAPLKSDNTIIDTEPAVWSPSHEGLTRIALLNNFGAAGSNGALLLEEYISTSSNQGGEEKAVPFIIGLSAKTEVGLNQLRDRYADWLNSPESREYRLEDIAYTATARRQLYHYRVAVCAVSKADLIKRLKVAAASSLTGQSSKVAFVFSGQGDQFLGMGSALYRTTPLFKSTINKCHSILTASGFPGILPIIVPAGETSGLTDLEELQAYQTAVFALEYALSQLWISWGVTPVVVVGHSLGEYAAQVIAGILSLEDALTLVATRARLMVLKCPIGRTGMIAVNLGSESVKGILACSDAFSSTSIACYNSENNCVVSGPISQLKALKAHLDTTERCQSILLTLPFGYHSSAMHPLLEDFALFTERIIIRPPTIAIVSTVLGDLVLPGNTTTFNADYYSRHCAEPVQFERAITSLSASADLADVGAWIEIGPHSTMLPMLKVHCAVSKEAMLLCSMRKQQDELSTLSTTLAQLYTSSISLRWREVFSFCKSPRLVPLPSYPFMKTKFWVNFEENIPLSPPRPQTENSLNRNSGFRMLYTWTQYPSAENDLTAVFETPIAILAEYICGHRVGGYPLCPASVYLELVLAGVESAKDHMRIGCKNSHVVLRDIEFTKPLVYSESTSRVVRTFIAYNSDDGGSFSISSRVGFGEESVHCCGSFKTVETTSTMAKLELLHPFLIRQIASVMHPNDGPTESFSTRTAYQLIFSRVVDYAEAYHTMKTLTVCSNGTDGYAVVQLPANYDRSKFVVHPIFMDTMLHVAGFVANMQGDANDAFICVKVHSVKVVPSFINNDAQYGVFVTNAWIEAEGIMSSDAYALGQSGRIVAQVKGIHFRKVQLNSLVRGLAAAAAAPSGEPKTLPGQVLPKRSEHRSSVLLDLATAHASLQPQADSQIPLLPMEIRAEITGVVASACDITTSALDLNAAFETYGVDSTVLDIIQKVEATHVFSVTSSPATLVHGDQHLELLLVDDGLDVKPLLASVLGLNVKDIGDNTEFTLLGLDSLASIEALHALQTHFGLQLPSDLLVTHSTISALHSYFSTKMHAILPSLEPKKVNLNDADKLAEMPDGTFEPLVTVLQLETVPILVQEASAAAAGSSPLFLIHDGSGLVDYIRNLSPLGRDVWGIHNPHFITSQHWDSVESMASKYAHYAANTTTDPLILGGWSFGGVVAFEAACQLLKKGACVKGVVLIDSPCPLNHVPLSDALLETVARLAGRNSESHVGRLVKNQFQINSRMLGRYNPISGSGPYPRLVLLRSEQGFKSAGISDMPRWLADRSNPHEAVAGWQSLVGEAVKAFDIPGNHFQPFHTSNTRKKMPRRGQNNTFVEDILLHSSWKPVHFKVNECARIKALRCAELDMNQFNFTSIMATKSQFLASSSRIPEHTHILLITTGSVASIKAPFIVEELLSYKNVSMQVIATKHALTFFTADEIRKRGVGVWTDDDEWDPNYRIGDPILHIELRRWADVVLVAPCSANTLAKVASGICDNLPTSLLRALSPSVPTYIFPAMNTLMYEHPLTAQHVRVIREVIGYTVLGPVAKGLACGDVGIGAMLEWRDIVGFVVERFSLVKNGAANVSEG
ncbi:hypothetical protein EW146_g801 [Bondarzewia mesenterica]|uniref:Uncharacterized protein n=1 Tax=Bondarzewia mesenterica TaxID=1095465 RepID=A0A4V3XGA8_9AGAM|nr:hypothetical protein EW146_g801 [Bondarzewia mesenterica]